MLQQYIQDFNKFSIAFPHIEQTLQALHQQGYVLGLISNGMTPFQEHNFYALGLRSFFSSILISEAVNLRKPDFQIFSLACEQLNVVAEECIFVGDNPIADILGAHEAKMKTIFFNAECSIHSQSDIECLHADHSIYHFDQLIQAIKVIEQGISL